MSKNIDSIALHEAGQAIANILVGIPFKYVTIKEETEKDERGKRPLGHIMYEKPKSKEEWDQYSFLNPIEFNIHFNEDLVMLAGLVAERIYRGRISLKGSKEDIRQWFGLSLSKLPESLSSAYITFILEYTFRGLQSKMNWSKYCRSSFSSFRRGDADL
jgi:hypothetical protein